MNLKDLRIISSRPLPGVLIIKKKDFYELKEQRLFSSPAGGSDYLNLARQKGKYNGILHSRPLPGVLIT